ncbi:hypothetical protein J2793_007163 [Paraburkholderia caledonica]|uniref:Uncharacterized protein n=1 Tax=Paraburkholderia caledonica TaxID=134536 RepID=A0AB73INU5_9BURK|nr:hypothetical protein [Paraburkholderia caledonica]
MNQGESMQCMFCGALGPNVCTGLVPTPGCKMPGLDARMAAHGTRPEPSDQDVARSGERTQKPTLRIVTGFKHPEEDKR